MAHMFSLQNLPISWRGSQIGVLDQHVKRRTRYLKVSEGGVFLKPTVVRTVLGSCLAGIFHDPASNAGAIFHAFLPSRKESGSWEAVPEYKFVDSAIQRIVTKFASLGIHHQSLQVMLLGGANSLRGGSVAVGPRNVATAYEVLSRLGMRVMEADVGGELGRNVVFITDTGEVFRRYLEKPVP